MKERQKVPAVDFNVRIRDESIGGDNPFRWEIISTDDYFGGKRVLVFSLPGAFTPTCSTYQVPGFEQNYDIIRSLGIDEIYVVSVNDTFVMRKWMLDQNICKVKFIPDGNGTFTRLMGMLVDKSCIGFGKRSWRYAMVVKDGTIEKFFEEPGRCDNGADDPYGETSPENVMAYLERQLSPA